MVAAFGGVDKDESFSADELEFENDVGEEELVRFGGFHIVLEEFVGESESSESWSRRTARFCDKRRV